MPARGSAEPLAERIRALAEAWRQVREDLPPGPLSALQARLRELATAGREQGERRLAELASVGEVLVTSIARESGEVDELLRRTLAGYIAAIEDLAGGAPAPPAPAEGGESPEPRLALLQSRDAGLTDRLRAILAPAGWVVEQLPPGSELAARVRSRRPAVVLLDLDAVPGGEPETELMETLAAASAGPPPPVVALADSGPAPRRLAAARRGVAGYWLKPVDPDRLPLQLDALMEGAEEPALRILLRDDSRTQATYYRTVLQRVGMVVEVAESADAVFAALAERPPDLLLLDLHMPGYDGAELARAVRQLPEQQSLPIVFLSMETDRNRQLDALAAGADDFLVKPVPTGYLLRALGIRARRARALRRQQGRDAATGAIAGPRLREQIRHEQLRAERCGAPLQLAVITLEIAPALRGEHGAGAVDSALRSVTQLLRARLRRTDTIGRSGDDALVVLLPGSTGAQARASLEPLLGTAAGLSHAGPGGQRFQARCRLGIAGYPEQHDPGSQLQAAAAAARPVGPPADPAA